MTDEHDSLVWRDNRKLISISAKADGYNKPTNNGNFELSNKE